ncbi:hypothetical protein MK139_08850 [bacterium]|nr:hypothetical protein [bacterium]
MARLQDDTDLLAEIISIFEEGLPEHLQTQEKTADHREHRTDPGNLRVS